MQRKDFSDWLVVSDIDGTLNDKYRRTVKANIEAISEFTKNGGNFTIASGRGLQSALKIYDRLDTNTPLIFLNGAGIYDNKNKKLLSFQSITVKGQAIVFGIAERYKAQIELAVHTHNMIYLVKPRIFGKTFTFIDKLDHKICNSLFEVPKSDWGKVTLFGNKHIINEIKIFVDGNRDCGIKAVLTSPFTLEIINASADKGNAVKRLAEILGIENHHTAAIGDYYNDLDMLTTAAISACCRKAPKEVKAISKYCACDSNKGAVADFLQYLTKNYINKD
ncbi:MAG TPA: Cof-type HAD-IIB family hydrolase [Clostridia bacterium]|nr:Cof-type HAD-IIB family hydrolase [Clostridia bacterium]